MKQLFLLSKLLPEFKISYRTSKQLLRKSVQCMTLMSHQILDWVPSYLLKVNSFDQPNFLTKKNCAEEWAKNAIKKT